MPSKLASLDMDDVIRRYQSGASIVKLAQEIGVSVSPIKRVLRAASVVEHRPPPNKITRLDVGKIVADYTGGASMLQLAKTRGVAITVIQRVLDEAGVERRDTHAAQRLRMAKASPEERMRALRAAHQAWTGRRHAHESLVRMALTRERHCNTVSPAEVALGTMLEERGYQVARQKAVGPFNIDLAVGLLGIEIHGGLWHQAKPHHAQRTRYLLNAGWHLVFVRVHHSRYPLGVQAADYIVAFLKELEREPPATCQYRVIRGTGKELARGRSDLDELPGIPAGH